MDFPRFYYNGTEKEILAKIASDPEISELVN